MAESGAQIAMARALGRGLPWLLPALALAGCKAEEPPGFQRYACTCAILTDTDGASRLRLEVCATPDAHLDAARGCAQTAAPATVERCDCQATEGACDGDECAVVER